ncbi:MAG: hypothetical protein ACOYB2_10445 [Limnohabitans sp.]
MLAIGDWVRRDQDTDPSDEDQTKWHLVESVVAGAAITKCGRRMEPVVDGMKLEVAAHSAITIDTSDRVQPLVCGAGCRS